MSHRDALLIGGAESRRARRKAIEKDSGGGCHRDGSATTRDIEMAPAGGLVRAGAI